MFNIFKKNRDKQNDMKKSEEVQLSTSQIKVKDKYLKEVMSKTELPIVILDQNWYNIKPLMQNEELLKKEQKLIEYIKEQGKLTNRLKEDGQIKQNLMKEILESSQRLNMGKDSEVTVLEKLQQGILKINEELKDDESRLEELGGLIKSINLEIIEEIVIKGYEYMEISKMKSKALDEEIDTMRNIMLEKTNIKKKCDEETSILYNYLHNIVGYKHIDKIDHLVGEE
ncbi:MAG: hypothetical protein ACRCSG_05695 [Cellulosilyticaceae bacterium]